MEVADIYDDLAQPSTSYMIHEPLLKTETLKRVASSEHLESTSSAKRTKTSTSHAQFAYGKSSKKGKGKKGKGTNKRDRGSPYKDRKKAKKVDRHNGRHAMLGTQIVQQVPAEQGTDVSGNIPPPMAVGLISGYIMSLKSLLCFSAQGWMGWMQSAKATALNTLIAAPQQIRLTKYLNTFTAIPFKSKSVLLFHHLSFLLT